MDALRRSTPLTASLSTLLSNVPYFARCEHTLSMGLPYARHSTNNHPKNGRWNAEMPFVLNNVEA